MSLYHVPLKMKTIDTDSPKKNNVSAMMMLNIQEEYEKDGYLFNVHETLIVIYEMGPS